MRIEVFDVGHGGCALITAPNERRMMLDCGERWGDKRFWTPALHYCGQRIDLLALMNLDEDHLRNFGWLTQYCTVPWILTNPTVGLRELRILKKDGMGPGAKAFAKWLAAPKHGSGGTQPDFGPIRIRYYYCVFDPAANNKTNDLSLVVIVQYGSFKIVFAGDLEVAGWRRLLALPSFLLDLMGTNILVASHHGRENGCCAEIFKLFKPEIVLISDDERQYESQDTDDWYRNRCIGARLIANPAERRYVMTTRKDGSMRINVLPDGQWFLWPVQVPDFPLDPPPTAKPRQNPFSGLASVLQSSPPLGLDALNPFANALALDNRFRRA